MIRETGEVLGNGKPDLVVYGADLLALLPLAPAAKLRRPMLRPKPVARGKKVLARK